MVGFGGIVYLIARGVPRIDDTLREEPKNKIDHKIDHWFSKIPIEKFDVALSNFLEKFLRRLRIGLLRMDNFLVKHLNKVKTVNQENNKKPDLISALVAEKTEEIVETKIDIIGDQSKPSTEINQQPETPEQLENKEENI
jgi:hypothetical protein